MSQLPSTTEEANAWAIVQHYKMKAMITKVFTGAFCISFVFTIIACIFLPSITRIISGSLSAILSPTVYKMSSHYFHALKSSKALEHNP